MRRKSRILILGVIVASLAFMGGLPATAASTTGTITGKVSVPAGMSPSDVTVVLRYGVWDGSYSPVNSVPVNADGSYTVFNVAPGKYTVEFDSLNPGMATQWYKNAVSYDTGTLLVNVTAAGTTSGIDAVMAKAATIAGKVTAPAGTDLTQLSVCPQRLTGSSGRCSPLAPDGTYLIQGMSAGSYKVMFNNWNGSTVNQWYPGAATSSAGKTLTVAAGQKLTGINDTLVKAATITGTVTALPLAIAQSARISPFAAACDESCIEVAVLDAGGAQVARTMIYGGGQYSVTGLAAGTYKVAFNRGTTPTRAEAQFYKAQHESVGVKGATPVVVATGATAKGINAVLTMGASISGTVLGKDGKALNNAPVRAYTKDGSLVSRVAWTNSQGKFTVTGLSTGAYFVVVNPKDSNQPAALPPLYVGNKLTEATAVAVSTVVGKGSTAGVLSYGPVTPPVPTISGTAKVGVKLAAVAGNWTAGTSLKYQWYRGTAAITGATSSSYTAVAADLGKKLKVAVTGTLAGSATASKTSAATAAVVAGTLVAPVPKISGTVKVNARLTATPGTWTSGSALTYQWYRGTTAIKGATGASYMLAAPDKGQAMKVRVTGVKTGYTTVVKYSAATAKVT